MMTRDEAERMCARFEACGWEVYVGWWNVWGSRCYVLAYHATLGSHRIETERQAAIWLARTMDQEAC